MEGTNKPKTHKGKKFLESREPKEIEDNKKSLFINTHKSNEIIKMITHDLVNHYLLNNIFHINIFI